MNIGINSHPSFTGLMVVTGTKAEHAEVMKCLTPEDSLYNPINDTLNIGKNAKGKIKTIYTTGTDSVRLGAAVNEVYENNGVKAFFEAIKKNKFFNQIPNFNARDVLRATQKGKFNLEKLTFSPKHI